MPKRLPWPATLASQSPARQLLSASRVRAGGVAVEAGDEVGGAAGVGEDFERALRLRLDALGELAEEDVVVFGGEIDAELEVLAGEGALVIAEDEHEGSLAVALLPGAGESVGAYGGGVGGECVGGSERAVEAGGYGMGLGDEDGEGDEGEDGGAASHRAVGWLLTVDVCGWGGAVEAVAVHVPGDGEAGAEGGGEEERAADEVVGLGAVGPDGGEAEAGAVVEDEDAETEAG